MAKPTQNKDTPETTPKGAFAEIVHFALNNKKWWVTPIIILLVVVIALIVLGGSGVAPFIYSLF